MRKRINKLNTPIWYIVIAVFILTALIAYFAILPYIRLMMGIPIDTAPYKNPYIWEIFPPIVDYASKWGVVDIAGAFICLFLGLVCFLLGAARSINHLSGKETYMQGLFLVLFALYTLSMVSALTQFINPKILFYLCWITFFIYPIPLFVYYFYYFAPAFQKWTWPLLVVPTVYGMAAWFMFLMFGLPLDIPGKPYTPITVTCFVVFLLLGLFGVKQKSMAWFIRAISGFWFGWVFYVLIKTKLGYSFYLHDAFKNGVTVSAVLIVCFLVFFNVQELASYKSDMQLLSLQNHLAKESYEHIKNHLREVGALKHEIRSHVTAMQMYLNDRRYEEAQAYLSQFAEQTNVVTEVNYHDNYLINAVVGNLLKRAREADIKVDLNLKPVSVHMAEPGLYSLLSNILDNAVEACVAVPKECDRFIRLTISQREPYFHITCENSKIGNVKKTNDKIQTTKPDHVNHGYGLWTISRIVDAHDGIMDIQYDENTFTITVVLKSKP